MNDNQLWELQRMSQKGTLGPWQFDYQDGGYVIRNERYEVVGTITRWEDAKFIVDSHNAIIQEAD